MTIKSIPITNPVLMNFLAEQEYKALQARLQSALKDAA